MLYASAMLLCIKNLSIYGFRWILVSLGFLAPIPQGCQGIIVFRIYQILYMNMQKFQNKFKLYIVPTLIKQSAKDGTLY